MRRTSSIISVLMITALTLILSLDYAYAYIDPGAGSLFLQVLVGLVASGAVAVKVYWNKIKDLVIRWLPGKNP